MCAGSITMPATVPATPPVSSHSWTHGIASWFPPSRGADQSSPGILSSGTTWVAGLLWSAFCSATTHTLLLYTSHLGVKVRLDRWGNLMIRCSGAAGRIGVRWVFFVNRLWAVLPCLWGVPLFVDLASCILQYISRCYMSHRTIMAALQPRAMVSTWYYRASAA